jgi:hypothetical protein
MHPRTGMKLFPQDLGQKRSHSLLIRRAGLTPRTLPEAGSEGEAARVGFWGRRWLAKSQQQVSNDEVQYALYSLRHKMRAWALLGSIPVGISTIIMLAEVGHGLPSGALPFIAGAFGVSYFSVFGRPRALLTGRLRRMRETPLTPSEIAALLPQATDELERSYLTLVMDVCRQEVSSSAAPGAEAGARADLREALQALGDAIDRLPTGRVTGSERPDIMTEVLRRTAEEMLQTAQAEPDRVVASSLIRQVEALHRRADATTRANTLVRRFWALRQEMAAETEALRAGLAAYYTGTGDVADLTRLVQSVREVAREAASVTAAVEEVDALSDHPSVSAVPASAWPPVPQAAAESPEVARLRLGGR